ncbi:prepilin-type N-terminal cleavage/methylation domain-containing protein [Aliiglaciecola litoralis]|uniref:Prepilin peptidase dependent protein B n=1 Tax=Aliiglaciecola litoralis TaxID=582857 RepID=A0ABN1LNC4_9ALTE
MLNANTRIYTGFSLIELLIAMAISISLITALISFVSVNLIGHSKLIMQQRLSDELHSIVSLIQSDLNRAGFDATSALQYTLSNNYAAAFANSIELSAFPGEPVDSCVTFAYDRDMDGEIDAANPNERFGFRLRENSIEVRQRGLLCDANGWQDISDSSVIIIDHFAIQTLDENGSNSRLAVRIDASSKQIPSIQRRIQRHWQISNEH